MQNVVLRQGCGNPPYDATQTDGICPAYQPPLFSLLPLVVDLNLDDEPVTVLVNHFKSKRDGEAETAPRRLVQAHFVRAVVDERLAAAPQRHIIVMGDLNDYPYSAPLSILTGDGQNPLRNVMMALPNEQRYSYDFDGVSPPSSTRMPTSRRPGRLIRQHLGAPQTTTFH